MKRVILISIGALGSLGAVMTITPPQFGKNGPSLGTSGNSKTTTKQQSITTATTAQSSNQPSNQNTNLNNVQASSKVSPKSTNKNSTNTKKKNLKSKKKKLPVANSNLQSQNSNNSTSTSSSESNSTNTHKNTVPSNTQSSGISGVFSGEIAQTFYGPVQVQITVKDGKIIDAKGLQYPTESFRDQAINSQAIPYLVQETLQAQSANIQGVGGASYTSQGWQQSLQSALSKAGL